MMKRINVGVALWLLAIATIGLAVALRPSNEQLSENKQALVQQQKRLKEVRQDNQIRLRQVKMVDLTASEKQTQDNLKKAFSTLLGGIKSEKEYQEKKPELKKILGSELTDVLFHLSYNGESEKFVIEKPAKVFVGFQNVDRFNNATVTVMCQYTNKGNLPIAYIYTLQYDLENQKVQSFKEQNIQVKSNEGNN